MSTSLQISNVFGELNQWQYCYVSHVANEKGAPQHIVYRPKRLSNAAVQTMETGVNPGIGRNAVSKKLLRAEEEKGLKQSERIDSKLQKPQTALAGTQEIYQLLSENLIDVIWILNVETNRFRYVSPSIQLLRGYTVEEVMYQDVLSALTPKSREYLISVVPDRIRRFKAGKREIFFDEFEQIHKDGHAFWTEVKARYVRNEETGDIEVIGVTRDITERKKHEKERDNLIFKLNQALEEIKTLEGILPICCKCKKIRDDEGYWNRIEAYISEHSNAKFSHGICPECIKELYPELAGSPTDV